MACSFYDEIHSLLPDDVECRAMLACAAPHVNSFLAPLLLREKQPAPISLALLGAMAEAIAKPVFLSVIEVGEGKGPWRLLNAWRLNATAVSIRTNWTSWQDCRYLRNKTQT
jgi:hypothetical protein